jgi:hypothetical protein
MNHDQKEAVLRIHMLIGVALLSGCVAYPAYYPAAPAVSSPAQAQAAANQECAKSGKVAVMVEQTNCDGQNCTTKFVCK